MTTSLAEIDIRSINKNKEIIEMRIINKNIDISSMSAIELITFIMEEIELIKERREEEKYNILNIKLKANPEQIEFVNSMAGPNSEKEKSTFASYFGVVLSSILNKLKVNKIPFEELQVPSVKVKIPLEYEIEIFNPNLNPKLGSRCIKSNPDSMSASKEIFTNFISSSRVLCNPSLFSCSNCQGPQWSRDNKIFLPLSLNLTYCTNSSVDQFSTYPPPSSLHSICRLLGIIAIDKL